jgi:predicted O-methyltransferase YrrM
MIAAGKELFKLCLRNLFELGQHLGLNILPLHFYSCIPDIRDLKEAGHWKNPRSMVGVNGADAESQLAFVRECCGVDIASRQETLSVYERCSTENGGSGYGKVEADFLFCFVRSKKPQKIVQIGAGLSTAVILLAAKDVGYTPEVVCIDPFPNEFLRDAHERHQITLIAKKAQLVELDLLTDLRDGDLLFVDSTHTVKPGSEVNYLILEVLPRLPGGSWVHFHDIYFPYDYPRNLMSTNLFFPNESVLLHAFLTNNQKTVIRASLAMLHYQRPSDLQRLLPSYRPAKDIHGMAASEGDFPSSIYLQVCRPENCS